MAPLLHLKLPTKNMKINKESQREIIKTKRNIHTIILMMGLRTNERTNE